MCQVPPWSPGLKDLMNCNLWLWVSELIGCHVPDDFMQIVLRHSVLRNTISRLIVASWSPQQFSYRGKNACKLWAKVAQQRKHGQFQLSMSLVFVLTSFVYVSEKRSYTSSSYRGMVKRLVRPLLEYRVPTLEESTSASSVVCRKLTDLALCLLKCRPYKAKLTSGRW